MVNGSTTSGFVAQKEAVHLLRRILCGTYCGSMCLLAGRAARREIEHLHGDGMADNLESEAKNTHRQLGGCIIVIDLI
jgi:hypothetical protein